MHIHILSNTKTKAPGWIRPHALTQVNRVNSKTNRLFCVPKARPNEQPSACDRTGIAGDRFGDPMENPSLKHVGAARALGLFHSVAWSFVLERCCARRVAMIDRPS